MPVAAAETVMMPVRIVHREEIADDITLFEMKHFSGGELPAFTAGAHIDVHLKDGFVRQYSLSNSPNERHRYVIGVLRDEAGRGGSKALHDRLRVQDKVRISHPRNNFELTADASKVILLAGGIGVTPLKAMAHRLEEMGIDYEMHYCAKDESCTVFAAELAPMHASGKLQFHFDNGDPSKGLDLKRLLSKTGPGVHVYYCGPGGFMKACAAATVHWAPGTVHFEHFKAPERAASDNVAAAVGEFIVKIASTGQQIPVSSDRSIADALEDAGVAIETSCRAGLCGTCKVRYVSGEVEHNDCILGDDEKQEYLTTCVSRASSQELVLDL